MVKDKSVLNRWKYCMLQFYLLNMTNFQIILSSKHVFHVLTCKIRPYSYALVVCSIISSEESPSVESGIIRTLSERPSHIPLKCSPSVTSSQTNVW